MGVDCRSTHVSPVPGHPLTEAVMNRGFRMDGKRSTRTKSLNSCLELCPLSSPCGYKSVHAYLVPGVTEVVLDCVHRSPSLGVEAPPYVKSLNFFHRRRLGLFQPLLVDVEVSAYVKSLNPFREKPSWIVVPPYVCRSTHV